jgi:hypothetical protein
VKVEAVQHVLQPFVRKGLRRVDDVVKATTEPELPNEQCHCGSPVNAEINNVLDTTHDIIKRSTGEEPWAST